MITYQTPRNSVILKVLLDGKVVGAIHGTKENGFYYRVAGGPCGETFKTVEAVKASLES